MDSGPSGASKGIERQYLSTARSEDSSGTVVEDTIDIGCESDGSVT